MNSSAFIEGGISAIVPTIGRVESLGRLLHSLLTQSRRPDEVIIADGSSDDGVARLIQSPDWGVRGLRVRHLKVLPPNAVRQRRAAIAEAQGEMLLLLDDDVELEPGCVEEMARALEMEPGTVAVTANFSNHSWSRPTTLWRWYLRWCCGLAEGQWQGRVIGPLLRFGYDPVPDGPAPMEWLGAGNSLIKRSAYDAAGGFSEFFLHRCTMNEDVDLGLKLGKVGRIFLCPKARMAHWHAPGGRVSASDAAEDDLFNRYMVLRNTQRRSVRSAFGLALLFLTVETISNLGGCLTRGTWVGFCARTWGRLYGLFKISTSEIGWKGGP